MCINGTERIIEKVNVRVIIDRSRELNPLLLSSTHVQASLTNLCQVPMRKVLNVLVQCTTPYRLLVILSVHGLPKEYIIAYSATLDPGRL